MTVGAHDVALGDFRDERFPAAIAQSLGDVERLLLQVLELEHDRVRFAAVDAR